VVGRVKAGSAQRGSTERNGPREFNESSKEKSLCFLPKTWKSQSLILYSKRERRDLKPENPRTRSRDRNGGRGRRE